MRAPWPLLTLIAIVATIFLFRYDYWKKDLVIRGDGYAYYGYINGTLVHGDPLNTFHSELEGRQLHRSWMHEGLPGRYLPKMTMGLAYAWVPGFFVADAIATLIDAPQDGWSSPYQLAVGFTGILFLLIGCWATWVVVRRRFSALIASLAVIIIYFVTNLLQYGSVDNSMSHVYSFALVALYLNFSDRWVSHFKTIDLLSAAFILGWITLIRPTNMIVGLYLPILLMNREGGIGRLLTLKTLLAAVVAFVPILPQLIFWKLTTGDIIHYSYEQEAFFWTDPEIIKGLFSYRNGWLVYTPIMALSIVGIPVLWNVDRGLFWAVGTVFLIHIYITFSWWCWYYGGSLSIRPMIDIYALLALGIAAFISWSLRRHWAVGGLVAIVTGALLWNNFLQVNYANLGVITDSTMTKKAFWATFMEPKEPSYLAIAGYYQDPDTDHLRVNLPERQEYDTTYTGIIGQLSLEVSRGGVELKGDRQYSNALTIDGAQAPRAMDLLIQVRMEFQCEDVDLNELHCVVEFKQGETTYQYQALNMVDLNMPSGKRTIAELYVKRPYYFPDSGEMKVFGWRKGKGRAAVYSLEVEPIIVKRKPLQ